MLTSLRSIALLALLIITAAGAEKKAAQTSAQPSGDGPGTPPLPAPQMGDASSGKDVFRFETMGTEGFWTDAARMPQGMAEAKLTPKQALEAGVQVDIDAIDPEMREVMARELKTDLSAANAPTLNDPATTVKLVEANAVIGVVPVHPDGTRTGQMRIAPAGPDKVGISCALCHTITDKSVFDLPNGGSIGKRVDGPANLNLHVGKLLATAANSRAFYPITHANLGLGKTVGGTLTPLSANSSEEDFDEFFNNTKNFPVGFFDDTPDGNGNPIIIPPFFRQDLAAPYGSNGQLAKLDDFNNQVYTLLFDQTNLLSPGGRELLKTLAGPAGEKLAAEYEKILQQTGVTGYPFVKTEKAGKPGSSEALAGGRVNNKKLLDLNAYLASLPAPKGMQEDAQAVGRGREFFRANCTSCHNADQSKPVPPMVVEMKKIWPGYKPIVVMKRQPPLSPVQNSIGSYDDKMIVVDASARGEPRGVALPLLLDLGRKNTFLHDGQVTGGLDELLNSKRGTSAPHPFYVDDDLRADVVAFLRNLDTGDANPTR